MNPDVVILSDYNKGFFHGDEGSILGQYHNSITIVDPKKGPLRKWRGCSIFKPNAKEAFDLSGKTKWKEQAKYFQNELECESVVITDGGRKVSGVHKDKFFCFTPDKQVEVESVIGAGDTFCVFLAMAVGHGFSVPEASEIAWNAGAVYVQNKMNRPIVPAEISANNIVCPEDLASRDFKLVFTNGCFDLLHEGHLQTLRFAREKGDKLVVALNSDESIKRLKGDDRPIKPLDQRMAVVAALEMVDFVVSFEEDTPLEVIKKIKPDVLVKGDGYCIDNVVGADVVSEVFIAPSVEGLSTTGFLKCNIRN
jgi:D-beta-D-heptose 7-phosphate kinase/D-beta-D-heptose 1-phosphate adenosyltransferase